MKIVIKYEFDPGYTNQFWAKTDTPFLICKGGKSFTEARERLLAEVRFATVPPPIPPDEEVEI